METESLEEEWESLSFEHGRAVEALTDNCQGVLYQAEDMYHLGKITCMHMHE